MEHARIIFGIAYDIQASKKQKTDLAKPISFSELCTIESKQICSRISGAAYNLLLLGGLILKIFLHLMFVCEFGQY